MPSVPSLHRARKDDLHAWGSLSHVCQHVCLVGARHYAAGSSLQGAAEPERCRLSMHARRAYILFRGQLSQTMLQLLQGCTTPQGLSLCTSSSSNSLTQLLLKPLNLQGSCAKKLLFTAHGIHTACLYTRAMGTLTRLVACAACTYPHLFICTGGCFHPADTLYWKFLAFVQHWLQCAQGMQACL